MREYTLVWAFVRDMQAQARLMAGPRVRVEVNRVTKRLKV
jgi:hypothetical protein